MRRKILAYLSPVFFLALFLSSGGCDQDTDTPGAGPLNGPLQNVVSIYDHSNGVIYPGECKPKPLSTADMEENCIPKMDTAYRKYASCKRRCEHTHLNSPENLYFCIVTCGVDYWNEIE
ncbi:hypothetical protein ACFL6Y_06755 [Elusimicrobiota bacterium]